MALVQLFAGGAAGTDVLIGGTGNLDGLTHPKTGEPTYAVDNAVFVDVTSTDGGRVVVRFTRPNAVSGPTEKTMQIDLDEGETTRVRIPLDTLLISNNPDSPDYGHFDVSWVSQQRKLQLTVVDDRIRQALQYTRSRLLEFPNNQRMDVATWQTIADEIVAEVSQKVYGGTIEVV